MLRRVLDSLAVSTRMLRIPLVLSLLLAGALAGSPAAGAADRSERERIVVRVAHGPIQPIGTVDAPPTGPSVGDFSAFYSPITRPGKKSTIGWWSGSLTTVAVGQPAADSQLRTTNFVFTIGRIENQIEVGGIASYPLTSPTLAKGTVTIRPVIGGSGRYDGARGYARTVHTVRDTWTHTFYVTIDR